MKHAVIKFKIGKRDSFIRITWQSRKLLQEFLIDELHFLEELKNMMGKLDADYCIVYRSHNEVCVRFKFTTKRWIKGYT